MTVTRKPTRRRPAALRALGSLGALLLAAAVGIGGVVGTAALVGPVNSDSDLEQAVNQAAPTVSLPPNDVPGPVLPELDANAPVPTADGLAAALAGPMSNPVLGTVAVQVVDPAGAQVLYSHNAATALKPASTMKIYTAAAAAVVLDPGTRITTSVVQGSAADEIVLVAGGDPTISSGPVSALNPGAASVADLAEQLQQAGIGSVSKITVDSSIFAGPVTAEGWGAGDAPSTYAAPIYPVMVDGGRSNAGDDASMRYADPDLHAAQVLAEALGSPDAEVVRGSAEVGAVQLAQVQSAPIEQLIEQMMIISDNVLAECLGRLVAAAAGYEPSFTGAVAAITDVMTQLGVDMTGFSGYDASGLSSANLASAQSLTSLLVLIAGDGPQELDVLASAMPVGGYSGTLGSRYENGPAAEAAGSVRAKTGTLTGVSSLAGTVLTADGRVLMFALLSNGGGPTLDVRAALDEVAAAIAACGCR